MGSFDDTKKSQPDTDETGFRYWNHAVADANGVAKIRFQHDRPADFLQKYGIVIARDAKRGLIALAAIERAQLGGKLDLHLVPECRVSGKIISRDLAKRGRDVTWTNVYLWVGKRRAMSCISGHGDFQFNLPPSEYRLSAYGRDLYTINQTINVSAGTHALTLPPLDLPATKQVLMEGLPAPPLRDVVAWKNSPPLELSQLKGKVVLLDFWGFWCGPCIARMPWLFELHDKYAKEGLVVIAVHLDAHSETPIDTPEKLDAKLADVRRGLWKGRDFPFPVAIVRSHPVPYGPEVHMQALAYSFADADYGITTYGSVILIDRRGKIAGELEESEAGLTLLKKLLADKSSGTSAAK